MPAASLRIVAVLILLVAVTVLAAVEGETTADAPNITEKLSTLVRITSAPKRMEPKAATACLPSPRFRKDDHAVLIRHHEAVIHVYVSPAGVGAMGKRDATKFPLQTLILKQKFKDKAANEVVLYTGMLKREQGYNPECGDWEFFTLDKDAETITSRGRLQSCMACHQQYAGTDFVTKQYPVEC